MHDIHRAARPPMAPGALAGVAELVDAAGLGPAAARFGGSSPSARTNGRRIRPAPRYERRVATGLKPAFQPMRPRPAAVRLSVTMQVTETLSDGLKHEFQVTVPAADLEARMSGKLSELKDRVNIRGFRPGKVPVTHLRKVYGRSVMAETVEAVIREMNAKIVEERGLRLAMEPKVTIPNEETEVERVIGGNVDLAYTLSLEVLPKIELGDFKSLKLERLTTEVTDAEVDEALNRIAEQNRPFAPKVEGGKVENGDRVVIDFSGKIDGVPFEGGTGGDV